MATYNITVHYAGEALNSNRIPIRDLAPSLLALSDTFKTVQSLVNPSENALSLDIVATEKGSFVVDLVLANGSDIATRVIDFLTSNQTEAVASLVMYSSIVIGGIKLVKRLAGKQIKDKQVNADKVTLTLEDGKKITVSENTLKAYQSVDFRKNAHDFVSPLSKCGIDSITMSHEDSIQVAIKDEDIEKFAIPALKEIELTTIEEEKYLHIVNVAFEHGKWKFSDGATQFFSKIEDKDFLESVEKNEQQFGSTDKLKVLLRTTQSEDSTGRLVSEYTIIKVLEHRKGTQQIELNFE